jgi:hypothetical protein
VAICTTTYLERQKCYGPDKKILFKKTLFDLEVKVPGRDLNSNLDVFSMQTFLRGLIYVR